MNNVDATLKAKTRATKKSTVKRLRKEGNIPAVLYGSGVENKTIFVNAPEFKKVFRAVGRNGIISLELENESYPVMVYDLQIDRMKNEITHADFYKVNMDEEIDAQVSVQLTGEAVGARDGGVVQHLLYELTVRALPAKFPQNIEVAIDDLEIGQSIQVADLPESPDYTIMNDPDETIVTVTAPTEEVVEEEAEEQTEPELVGKSEEENSEE